MKKITLRWQRLLDEYEQTCPRCYATGETITSGYSKLKTALAEFDIEVELIQEALDFAAFSRNPPQSNCIWINGTLLEEWLGGQAGTSKCCDVCGDSECRTISFGDHAFESVPENLIIKAALLAAAKLMET